MVRRGLFTGVDNHPFYVEKEEVNINIDKIYIDIKLNSIKLLLGVRIFRRAIYRHQASLFIRSYFYQDLVFIRYIIGSIIRG